MAMAACYSENNKLMIRNVIVQLYLFLQPFLGFGQSLSAEEIAVLPDDLDECSGMCFIAPNAIAMINDSGNEAELFICDTLGQLIMRPKLLGLPNRDWESLAYSNGLLYIGDFGNNSNKRSDLEILVLDLSKLLSEEKWSLLGRIPFKYPEQKGFPPQAESDWYYDLEAMITNGDSIYLFTKNRTKPFDGLVKVYGLSTEIKGQEAKLIKEFKTNIGLKHFNWVSGASIGPNGDDLFLLGYSKVWYISNWRQADLDAPYAYSLGYFSQKEAIAIRGDQLYFAEEKNKGYDPYLRKTSVELFLNQYHQLEEEAILLDTNNFHAGDSLSLQFRDPHYFLGTTYILYNTAGTAVFEGTLSEPQLKNGVLDIEIGQLPAGRYILSFNGKIKRAFVISIL